MVCLVNLGVCASCGSQRRVRKRASGNGRNLFGGLAALEQCNGSAGCKNLAEFTVRPDQSISHTAKFLDLPRGPVPAVHCTLRPRSRLRSVALGVCTQSCHPIGCLLDTLPKRAGSGPLCVTVCVGGSSSAVLGRSRLDTSSSSPEEQRHFCSAGFLWTLGFTLCSDGCLGVSVISIFDRQLPATDCS